MREEGKSKKAKGEEYEENEVMEVEEGGGESWRENGGKKARANRRYYETPRNNYYRVITRRA